MKTTYLYRAKDESGCVLYVGITSQPSQRLATHTRSAPWSDLAVLPFDWVEFNTKEAAMAFEREEIIRLRPEFNTQCNPDKSVSVNGDLVRINFTVSPATRAAWKKLALDKGVTLQQLIVETVNHQTSMK